jgi:Flp pilus assembly protein TadG
MKIPFKKRIIQGTRAQAMVEFALVLMILMVVLVGILEVGRLLFIYAAVNNASREATRYASAIGLDDSGNAKYQYCDGIRNMAQRSAFFTPLTITISYDHGPGTGSYDSCDGSVDTGVVVNAGSTFDRVQVQVSAQYDPMVSLIPIDSRTITSSSARTILGYVDLDVLTSSAPNTPIPTTPTTPGATLLPDTPTATAVSHTPTATLSGEVITLTPLPTSTATLVPTITPTATVTPTTTQTWTPTLTFTPTITPTAMPGCNSITTGSLIVVSNVMSLSFTNPHDTITVLNVQVSWNSTNGGAGSKPLALKSASLGGVFWAGTESTGTLTITPSTTLTIPGNNVTSAIMFSFDKNYQNKNNSESIVINLSTPGCEGYTIRRP